MERYEGPFICPKTGEPADDYYCCMLCDSPPEGYEGDEGSWQVACWRFNLELIDDRWVSRWKVQRSSPTRKPGDAPQVGASPENRDRVLKEIDQKEQGENE